MGGQSQQGSGAVYHIAQVRHGASDTAYRIETSPNSRFPADLGKWGGCVDSRMG
jgi:hypothetical protein